MEAVPNTAQRAALSMSVFASAILLVVGGAFVSREFGFRGAAMLSLLPVLPLVVAVRLRRRWPAVPGRELTFLLILFCAAAGGSAFVVRAWYAAGLDRRHADDVRWTEFERRMRRDSAFQDIQVHKPERKNIHWASGAVDSEADLAGLHSLAAECGIERKRLDKTYVNGLRQSVRGGRTVEP